MSVRTSGRAVARLTPLLLAVSLAGCGGGSLTQIGTNPNDSNQVRVFNAFNGASIANSAIDVVQRDAKLNAQPLQFGQSTDYVKVASGLNVNTSARFAGTQNNVVPSKQITMNRNFYYTLAVVGVIGQLGDNIPQIVSYIDNIPVVQGTVNAALRVINLSPNAGLVSIYNTSGNPPTPLPIAGAQNIGFKKTSTGTGFDYVVVPGTTNTPYNLSVRSNVGSVITTKSDLSKVRLDPGHSYTLFLVGQVNAPASRPAFDAILVQDI